MIFLNMINKIKKYFQKRKLRYLKLYGFSKNLFGDYANKTIDLKKVERIKFVISEIDEQVYKPVLVIYYKKGINIEEYFYFFSSSLKSTQKRAKELEDEIKKKINEYKNL
jgi:hypothetical protein